MAHIGQTVKIHSTNGKVSTHRVTKVFSNGRIQISGKFCNWYEEVDGLFRVWNNPGFFEMVAELV